MAVPRLQLLLTAVLAACRAYIGARQCLQRATWQGLHTLPSYLLQLVVTILFHVLFALLQGSAPTTLPLTTIVENSEAERLISPPRAAAAAAAPAGALSEPAPVATNPMPAAAPPPPPPAAADPSPMALEDDGGAFVPNPLSSLLPPEDLADDFLLLEDSAPNGHELVRLVDV